MVDVQKQLRISRLCRKLEKFERMAFGIAELECDDATGRLRQVFRAIFRNGRPAGKSLQMRHGLRHARCDDGAMLKERTPALNASRVSCAVRCVDVEMCPAKRQSQHLRWS